MFVILGFVSTVLAARVGRPLLDRWSRSGHVLSKCGGFLKILLDFILQLEITINFEIEYLFHINSFSGVSSFCNLVIL